MYVIRILDCDPRDTWLVSCDLDQPDGLARFLFSYSLADAMQFATPLDALCYYQRQSTVYPLRLDGKPNRPMTGFSIEIRPLPSTHDTMTANATMH